SFNQKDNKTLTLSSGNGIYTIKLKSTSPTGTVTETERVVKLDTEAPAVGSVKYGESIIGTFINYITFGAFGNTGKTITINSSDRYSGVGKIEYQIIEKDKTSGEWLTYNASSKPTVDKAFTGQVLTRVWDDAGNTNKAEGDKTKYFMTEDTAPTLNLTANQDTTAWQEEVKFDVTLQDQGTGVQKIVVQDKQNGKDTAFTDTETYNLPYSSDSTLENQPNLSWSGSPESPGVGITRNTLPYGAKVDDQTDNFRDTNGLVTGAVKFT
ncbi:MAG: hypothetical protein RR614_04770, partial [Eubacterium sp.]